MTRRKFVLSLLGSVGSVVVGFGIVDYVNNMKKIFESDYFVNGRFRNKKHARIMNEGTSLDTAKRWLFNKNDTSPKKKIHFDADKIPKKYSDDLRIMWTSHSSIYIEIEGKRLFCDPVWSMNLSPIGFGGPKRFFENPLNRDDIPDLDGVLISHNHMDHLDKSIVKYLSQKGVPFYVPTGVDYILKSWDVPQDQIFAADWYDTLLIDDSIKLTSLPAIHFSGRGLFDKNKSQWTSWVIEGKKKKVYFGGDSGYHDEFKEIGEKYGPFDMTFLEIGAYDKNWEKIHLGPELAVQAHIDLKGKVLLPIHWGAYDLAIHPWKEPVERIISAAEKKKVTLSLPKPGQLLTEDSFMENSRWWEA
jgi:L-ascorbate metabolism protein UlaG (beta-lactamase superfamily)